MRRLQQQKGCNLQEIMPIRQVNSPCRLLLCSCSAPVLLLFCSWSAPARPQGHHRLRAKLSFVLLLCLTQGNRMYISLGSMFRLLCCCWTGLSSSHSDEQPLVGICIACPQGNWLTSLKLPFLTRCLLQNTTIQLGERFPAFSVIGPAHKLPS